MQLPGNVLHEAEKYPESTPQDTGREADERCRRQADREKGAQRLQQTRDHTQGNLCGRVSSTTGDAAPAEQTARTGCITHGQP